MPLFGKTCRFADLPHETRTLLASLNRLHFSLPNPPPPQVAFTSRLYLGGGNSCTSSDLYPSQTTLGIHFIYYNSSKFMGNVFVIHCPGREEISGRHLSMNLCLQLEIKHTYFQNSKSRSIN